MSSISLDTFVMGQQSERRSPQISVNGEVSVPAGAYIEYTYRDASRNRRLRKWVVTRNLRTHKWTVVKEWTQAIVGEPHYVRVPQKIEQALLVRVHRDFFSP